MNDRVRRLGVAVACLCTLAVLAACAPADGGGAPATTNFRFRANQVTVDAHNDSFIYGDRDEPFVYNLWFRVKVGVPGSAQVGSIGERGNAVESLGDGQTAVLVGGQQAEVNFNDVKLLDVLDLADTNKHLEIVGTWTWAMEKDDVSVRSSVDDALAIVRNSLNTILANGSVPTDPGLLVEALLGDFGDIFGLVASSLFNSVPGIPDDAIGSRFYVGVGATGALHNIIDAAFAEANLPNIAIPIVSVPPDINGGKLFSLGRNHDLVDQEFSGDGTHRYDFQMVNTATLNQPPVASFTSSTTTGPAPLVVSFNGAGSSDVDGSIVSYQWDFGDFTTGNGVVTSHTFTSPGVYPVKLTVVDDDNDPAVSIQNIVVPGAPQVAPTGVRKVGQGCCDTYGDFAWNPVPGAQAYEVSLDGFFLGGCVTDHSAVINGQVSGGRVQAAGLCLGSQYDVRVRAQANGQWGPWSDTVRVTL